MYKIITVIKTDENNKEIIFYGIESSNVCYPDLTTDYNAIDCLCKLCNKYEIDAFQLKYIIEDFLNSNSWLSSIFPR